MTTNTAFDQRYLEPNASSAVSDKYTDYNQRDSQQVPELALPKQDNVYDYYYNAPNDP
jgi:hypothetical protein